MKQPRLDPIDYNRFESNRRFIAQWKALTDKERQKIVELAVTKPKRKRNKP